MPFAADDRSYGCALIVWERSVAAKKHPGHSRLYLKNRPADPLAEQLQCSHAGQ